MKKTTKKSRAALAAKTKKSSSKAKPKPKTKTKAAPKKTASPKKKTASPKKKKATTPRSRSRSKAKSPASVRAASSTKWLAFVEKHGVVLASAKGPVPNLADEVAGEPIVGSWWSHPKGQQIFETLSAIDEDVDVRCFKLVDGKVTFVHRRVWPALVRVAREGVIPPGRVESVHQEHTESGEHRNFNVAFPEWVPDEVAAAADAMTVDDARAQLGSWLG